MKKKKIPPRKLLDNKQQEVCFNGLDLKRSRDKGKEVGKKKSKKN